MVLIRPAGPGSADLEELLGPERTRELARALASQAENWARGLAPDGVYESPPDTGLVEEVERVFREGPAGPLLVVWPGLPRLRAEHGEGALEDLSQGCDLVFGPVVDGGLYLLGLVRTLPEVLEKVAEAAEGGPGSDATAAALAAAAEAGLEIGYLRPERSLRTAADVAAALADPLTPEPIRRILEA